MATWLLFRNGCVMCGRRVLVRMCSSSSAWTEHAKIAAAKKHFEAIGIDYAKSSPKNWNV